MLSRMSSNVVWKVDCESIKRDGIMEVQQDRLNNLLDKGSQIISQTDNSGLNSIETFSSRIVSKSVLFSSSGYFDARNFDLTGHALRYRKGNHMFFQSFDDIDIKEIKVQSSNQAYSFSEQPFDFTHTRSEIPDTFTRINDQRILDLTVEDMVKFVKDADSLVTRTKSPLFIESGLFSIYERYLALHNSNGLELGYNDSFLVFQLRLIAGTTKEIVFEQNYRKIFRKYEPNMLNDLEKSLKDNRLKFKNIKGNKILPVVFSSQAMNQLGDLILRPLLSNIFQDKDISTETSINPRLTVLEEANDPTRIGSLPFDMEGTKTKVSILFEEGRIKERLKDLNMAYNLNKKPSGTTLRGLPNYNNQPIHRLPPAVVITNIAVKSKILTRNDPLEDVKNGIWINGISSIEYFDIRSGDFKLTSTESIHINNGELSKAAGRVNIYGNIFELLRKVVGLGTNIKEGYFSKIPDMHISSLRVKGKESKDRIAKLIVG